MITESKLKEIEDAAGKATPGEWTLDNSDPNELLIIRNNKGRGIMQFSFSEPDCKFVCMANPETILSLVAEIRKLREVASQCGSQCTHLLCPDCVVKLFNSKGSNENGT